MTTATLETVTAATICKPKPSKYKEGNYVSVCFGFSDNTEQWVNYDEGAEELSWLERGHQYQAMVAGDKITLIRPDSASQPAQAPTSQPAPAQVSPSPTPAPATAEDPIEAAAAHATSLARLYGHCYEQVLVNLERYQVPEETVRSAATTLFISVTRKHNL